MDAGNIGLLKEMGFSAGLIDSVQRRIRQGFRQFKLPDRVIMDADIIRCVLDFHYEPTAQVLSLEQYEAMLQVELDIKHLVTPELDSRILEKQMQDIPWNGREFTRGYLIQYARIDELLEQKVDVILQGLQQLRTSGEQGRIISEQLQLKFWYDTIFNKDYLDTGEMDYLSRRYYPFRSFSKYNGLPSIMEAYDMLLGKKTGGPATGKRKAKEPRSGGKRGDR